MNLCYNQPWPRAEPGTDPPPTGPTSRRLTVDELARAAGTTTRQVRALQTQGLLPHPDLVGRTGYYDADHLDRLRAVLRLQAEGFSLASLDRLLLRAWESNMTLAQVLGLPAPIRTPAPTTTPTSSATWPDRSRWSTSRRGRLLSLVPSTILDQAAASVATPTPHRARVAGVARLDLQAWRRRAHA